MDKVVVLELIGNCPRNKVTSWTDTSGLIHLFSSDSDVAFETDLDGHQHFWDFHPFTFFLVLQRTQEDKDSMSRCI